MIRVEDILFEYAASDYRLCIPEFVVGKGEQCVICGPSGCGKTTLLQLVAGIQTPAQGTVRIGETTISELNDCRRRQFRIRNIGFVFQNFELIEYLNVRDNVLLPYFINSSLRLTTDLKQKSQRLAESLGLSECWRRSVSQLSQGERQRVAIARSLVAEPSLLLADEPTGNLDPRSRHEAIELLRSTARSQHATLIVVSHDESVLAGFDRVIRFPELLQPETDGQPR